MTGHVSLTCPTDDGCDASLNPLRKWRNVRQSVRDHCKNAHYMTGQRAISELADKAARRVFG